METPQPITKESKRKETVKKGAKIALIILLLHIVGQLTAVYQTRYQLTSPIIPESTIWAINKQFVFIALVSALVSVVGLILYFFDKYLLIIILIAITLIGSRFIYI